MSDTTEDVFVPRQLEEDQPQVSEPLVDKLLPVVWSQPFSTTLAVSSSSLLDSSSSLDRPLSFTTPSAAGPDAPSSMPPPALVAPKEEKPTEEEELETLSGETPNRVGWSKVGWFAGVEHCVAWPPAPPNTGLLRSGAGLSAQNLAEPGMGGFIDPALAPKNEAEWKALFETAFDDIAHEPPARGCVTYADRYRTRVGVERCYFSGGSLVHNMLLLAPRLAGEKPVQLHCRLVGKRYAVGTMILCTPEVEAIYERISKASRLREVESVSTEMEARISEAVTTDACREILVTLANLKKGYTERATNAENNKDALADLEVLQKSCEERLQLCEADEIEIREAKEADPPRVPWLQVLSVGTKPADAPRSNEALETLLRKMRRPTHVVSTVTLPIGEDGMIPLLALQEDFAPPGLPLFAHRRDKRGRGPYDHITDDVIKAKLCVLSMEPTTQSTNKWNPCAAKLKLEIPCCLAEHDRELFIADHTRFYVVQLPAGKATGETYQLPPRVAMPELDTVNPAFLYYAFKVVMCSITARHVSIMGYRKASTAPLLIVIDRASKLCTFVQSDIPFTSATLSTTVPGTVLLGMKEGTVLRVAIPAVASKKGRPVFTVYHPGVKSTAPASTTTVAVDKQESTQLDTTAEDARETLRRAVPGLGMAQVPAAATKTKRTKDKDETDDDDSGDSDEKKEVDYDALALTAIRRARPRYHIQVFEGSQDWVLHIGRPMPISRIVERAQRIVLSSPFGLTLFRLHHPETSTDRRIHMILKNNISFDFRGNLLVALKQDNAVQLAQIHDCKVQSTMSRPADLVPQPPEYSAECQAICIQDEAIIIVHGDGSRRVMQLRDPVQVTVATPSGSVIDSDSLSAPEDKARSFLPATDSSSSSKAKAKGKGKKKTKGAK